MAEDSYEESEQDKSCNESYCEDCEHGECSRDDSGEDCEKD